MKKNNELLARVVKEGFINGVTDYNYVTLNTHDNKFHAVQSLTIPTELFTYVCTREEYEDAKSTGVDVNVNVEKYTPKVGDECLMRNQMFSGDEYVKSTPKAISDDFIVIVNNGGYERVFSLKHCEFKPLPTEEGKSIDDINKILRDAYSSAGGGELDAILFSVYTEALIKAGYHNQPKVKPLDENSYLKMFDICNTESGDYKWLVDNNHIVSE